MPEPVRPDEKAALGSTVIPQVVFEVFNRLIELHWTGTSAVIKETDVVNELVEQGFSREEIVAQGMLNVGAAYQYFGWKVVHGESVNDGPIFRVTGP